MEYEVPFVDYYKKHGISPVSQDITDINKHFRRRHALYKHLGLPSGLLKGKRILEFGPGSGHNALFTASMAPSLYVFVDGNPIGLSRTKTLLGQGKEFVFVESLIDNFTSNEKFDVVICEGLLHHQEKPREMLKHVASFVNTDGILLITCIDAVSHISDALRHYAGRLICDVSLNFNDSVSLLSSVFQEHLNTLKFASRPVEEWVMDSILQSYTGNLFSIQDAIQIVCEDFDISGVSPHFFKDWRWYKQICDVGNGFNDIMIECYQKNLHSLLDHNCIPFEREAYLNLILMKKAVHIFDLIHMTDKQDEPSLYIAEMIDAVNSFCEDVRSFDKEAFESLKDYQSLLQNIAEGEKEYNWGKFRSFWGRGQQNLSFVRKLAPL
jgi:SAM-dependent methyltransferase